MLGDPNNGGIEVVGGAPYSGVGWPDEWTILVEGIRSSPNGLA